MPVLYARQQDDVIYTFIGHIDSDAAHRYFDLNYADYHEIGDAIGVIIDISEARVRFGALNTASQRMKGVVYHTPVAFVGKPDTMLATFLAMLEAMSSKGARRFSYFSEVESAIEWIEGWFEEQGLDRAGLRGQITATPTLPHALNLSI